ncbi:L-dopachrome tautomerase-related protein [Chitinophaga pinensis]|uniref:Major royal jelly protein n=1 Tax=Chitinophaga pinensis (strain ATCC 43595 / DSM 2588 / LMG 13176 / NBRC 15968 / NCIMB 11800 / UQM 2034) TaxID=485918 RepID=A0A979GWF0_CHIPD|nr:L-dopachrome tautomerase-related protein [Chitinophaga pinensis]ACU61954.1 major royal jelly protein [Chitinophaga pinensis DSM 2588]
MKNNFIAAVLAVTMTGMIACSKDDDHGERKLELMFEDNTYQLTGVAKEENGRLLVNYPRWSDIYQYAVVITNGKTGKTPYPDVATNQWSHGLSGLNKWVCVQSVYFDKAGTLWILDPAAPKLETIQGNGAKLVRMDKQSNTIARTYSFTPILADTSYVNDVRVDVERQYAYLTESKGGGIIVVNLADGQMRRVLQAHYSTISDPSYKFIIDGRELMKDGKPAKFNSDGIALTPDGNWLYYKPLSDDKLYRIKTEHLRNPGMTAMDLESQVEDLGHFTTTDGMIFDEKGNLYMGDLQGYRIVKLDSALRMTTLVKDDRLIWPDSYSIADGYLYISCSQIQKQPEYNNGVDKRTSPYTVYRIKI